MRTLKTNYKIVGFRQNEEIIEVDTPWHSMKILEMAIENFQKYHNCDNFNIINLQTNETVFFKSGDEIFIFDDDEYESLILHDELE